MNAGLCFLSVVPLRAEPSERAEQVTQLLFGEAYTVLLRQGHWLRVRGALDGYEGWLAAAQHTAVSAPYFAAWEKAAPHPRTLDLVQVVSDDHARIPVQLGSVLPFFDGLTLRVGERKLFYNGLATNNRQPAPLPEMLLPRLCQLYRHAPYQWGGKSVFGLDCSGFTQQVFALLGHALPRDAWQQAAHGAPVHFASQARAGDLAFFDNAEGRIVHVGVVLGDGLLQHASGHVRVDLLDHQGIYQREQERYTHQLRLIKRVF